MKKAILPAIFKWRQTAREVCAVTWYFRYSLSLRDVEELLTERGSQRPGGRPHYGLAMGSALRAGTQQVGIAQMVDLLQFLKQVQ